jgi:signal transduction histidine kinase
MKLDMTSLRSRVARRIFSLFVLCALVPIGVLAVISFREVTTQLNEQSRSRLRQGSKALGLSLYERLLFLETELRIVAANLQTRGSSPDPPLKDIEQRFTAVALLAGGDGNLPVFGELQNPAEFTESEWRHLRSGKTLLSVQHHPARRPRTLMSRAADSQDLERGVLQAEIKPEHLWSVAEKNTLPAMTELCVLDYSHIVLFCSLEGGISFHEQVGLDPSWSSSGEFDWAHDGREYLAAYWSIPLKFNFLAPQWTIVLFEAKADILAPMARFKRIFPLVIALFTGMVVLLSLSQIRRILVPLEKLHEGTRRIGSRDFASRVVVRSGDEFEDLAASFNMMADRLARQFKTLAAMADVDRAILSVLDTERIVRTVLARMPDVLSCDAVAVTVLASQDRGQVHVSAPPHENGPTVENVDLPADALTELRENPQRLSIDPGASLPGYLAPLARCGCASFVSLPVFFKETLSAIISLGYSGAQLPDEETLSHARQIADQVAIGISNSRLYSEIEAQALSLEKANKVKDEFLSVMSHELRTPLTVVKGYTGMQLEGLFGQITEEQEKALRLVMSRTDDLLALITTILEATRIESQTVEVVHKEVDLRALLEILKTKYMFREKKEITMSWEYPLDLPAIRTDPEKLGQILENLINNAVKFTARGSVVVSARREGGDVEFNIRDTGIGIPADALPVIFEKFRQLDSSDNRLYEGAGLGLYIVKKFTELLGGKLEVVSAPGEGSVFSVRIPCS